jgi:hypothetical protein
LFANAFSHTSQLPPDIHYFRQINTDWKNITKDDWSNFKLHIESSLPDITEIHPLMTVDDPKFSDITSTDIENSWTHIKTIIQTATSTLLPMIKAKHRGFPHRPKRSDIDKKHKHTAIALYFIHQMEEEKLALTPDLS